MTRRLFVDIFDDDDPAVSRLRDALAANAKREPPTPAPEPAPPSEPEPSRHAKVSSLLARVRAGDLSAVDQLRKLLDK